MSQMPLFFETSSGFSAVRQSDDRDPCSTARRHGLPSLLGRLRSPSVPYSAHAFGQADRHHRLGWPNVDRLEGGAYPFGKELLRRQVLSFVVDPAASMTIGLVLISQT